MRAAGGRGRPAPRSRAQGCGRASHHLGGWPLSRKLEPPRDRAIACAQKEKRFQAAQSPTRVRHSPFPQNPEKLGSFGR